MATNQYHVASATQSAVIERNLVLKNTYILLSLTLMFSAVCAGIAMLTNASSPGIILFMVGTYGLLFLTHALQNSPWGILSVFAFCGFMGYTIGPILNMYLRTFSNGSSIIMTAMGATGVIFLALSGHVLTARKDYSFLDGFLFAGIIIAILASLGAFVFQMPALHLAVSGVFALLSSGLILSQTSAIIHGGERNYIIATINLYVSIYNLFMSLLHIFGAFAGDRD